MVLETEGVASVHAIRTRKLGKGIHVDLHLVVDGKMSVKVGHDISEQVKQKLDNPIELMYITYG